MRGNANREDLKMIFMSVKGQKKGENVHFKQTEALGDKKYNVLEETIDRVQGKLSKLETKTKEYEGKAYEELRVWLKDNDAGEMYCVSVSLGSSIGRNLANTVAGTELKKGDDFVISVYTNKKGFPSLYTQVNGHDTSWKFDYKADLEPLITKTAKKVKDAKTGAAVETIERDYFNHDEFLLAAWKQAVEAVNGTEASTDHPEPVPANAGDLPF